MAISTSFSNSVQVQFSEHDFPSEERNSGCVLANLMRQSLAMYLELEKTHWHLRLNSAGPTEVAREACTICLQLIASIFRLQRTLEPKLSPDCERLFAAVQEKIAEVCELSSERQFNSPAHLETLALQGSSVLRDFRFPENPNLF